MRHDLPIDSCQQRNRALLLQGAGRGGHLRPGAGRGRKISTAWWEARSSSWIPSAKKTDLFTFTGNDAGVSGDLVLDANGNLYGVTPHGTSGFGTVFKLTTPADFAEQAN